MLIITPQQLTEGWFTLCRSVNSDTPETVWHPYRVIYQRRDGNYLVEDPADYKPGTQPEGDRIPGSSAAAR